ncbi:MAG: (d)CMP kinase [Bacteroidota bacterium]
MYSGHFIVAIDGPAASGKSTTARRSAEELGFLHLDTGAMYRAVTLKVLRRGIDVENGKAIVQMVEGTHIELRNPGGQLTVLLDGAEVSAEIRSEAVTEAVSAVSRLRGVRAAMVREQRRAAEYSDIVAEGRDIGTVVFPDADLKFFMVAGIEARARRRQAELAAQGIETDLKGLVAAIRQRDLTDSTRNESPLRKAADAIEIDTSDLTIEQQVAVIVTTVKERLERIRGR